MSILYRPMKKWPEDVKIERLRAPFKADHRSTLALLEREIRMISGRDAVVELALHEGQFTREGLPYSNATPEHPGVIVRVRKPVRNPHGKMDMVPLYFPAGRFSPWQANMRAVAIALEDLRRIDRYGVTQNSEQYTGFKQLPPPGPEHPSVLTVEEAARVVAASVSGCVPFDVLTSPDNYRRAYRERAARLHPDAGGALDEWMKLQAAKSLLDAHHGKGTPA